MKIGELNMHCGECCLIDHCGEPYSDVAICMEKRLKDIKEESFYKYLENAHGKTKKDIIDNAYLTYLMTEKKDEILEDIEKLKKY